MSSQSVYMMFDHRPGRPWGDEARLNEMVFIGRHLDRQRIEEGILSCMS